MEYLGPDGGDKGGEIVVVGTPVTVAEHLTSHAGRYLKQVLERRRCASTLMRQ